MSKLLADLSVAVVVEWEPSGSGGDRQKRREVGQVPADTGSVGGLKGRNQTKIKRSLVDASLSKMTQQLGLDELHNGEDEVKCV